MSNITILRPTWSGATTAKTFTLEDNKIKTVKSYDLGKLFNYATTEVKSISELHTLLKKCENKKAFRIYGRPVEGLPQPARRLKENFICDETNLVLLDADNWKVPDGYSIDTKQNLAKTVKHILVDKMKLTAFKDAQFCCLLSSSQWNKDYLRAHLYFLLDEPVALDDLHQWGYEHNSLAPDYKIDYSLFRQVQPDFISKRICLGFKDTMLSDLRLTPHCDHLSPYVRKADLLEHFKAASVARAGDPYASTNTLVGSSIPIGSTWEKTIAMAGSAEMGINEPTYRACAQLVQEVGDNEITNNLTHHVNRVFQRMWDAIVKHGVRGDKADRDLYTREKIKGYLTTAVAKKFGEKADADTKEITEAIAAIKTGSTPSVMFTKEVLAAIANLKDNAPEKWANVKAIIKRDLKGQVIIGDLEKAAVNTKEKQDLELVLEDVIERFKWYVGEQDNCLYCMSEKDNGYTLKALSDGIEDDIYVTLFGMMGGHVPKGFEHDVVRLTVGRKDDYRSPFLEAPIENRCYSEVREDKHIAYYNIGATKTSLMQTVRIDEDGIRVIPSVTAPVIWKTATNTLVAPVLDVEDELELLGEMGKDLLIEDYINGMRKYTTVSDMMDLLEVAAWQVATIMNTGAALILQITGASNCGKSSTATFVKDLCDPTSKSLKDSPDLHNKIHQDKELAKVLRGRHVTVFDNMSKLSDEEQNMLCMLATGWQYDYRVLYSNSIESIRIRKPVILTALTAIVGNEDLRSRTLSVIAHQNMKSTEGAGLFASWKDESPRIRAGLLMLVSRVIKRANELIKVGIHDDSHRSFWGIQAKIVLTEILNLVPNFSSLTYEQQVVKVLERQEIDSRSDALLDGWKAQFAAWIWYSDMFKKKATFRTTTHDMFKDFETFIHDNAGETLDVDGVNITLKAFDIPRDTRQFGTKFGKSITDIERVTGWQAESTRTSTQRMWKFTPRTQTTEQEGRK